MDFIISEKEKSEPTICLNMIVKNESHIIKETLEKLCQKIKFSYWVICDTGSTDNTQEIIKSFFANKNIPGEMYQDTWLNFAHNRTVALQYAFNKTDLLLVFDADDEIVGDIQMPKADDVKYDEYHLKFGSAIGTAYTRVLLINNKKRFMYQSVIHEFICCVEPTPNINTSTVIEGNYYVVSGRSGNRNQDPEKYLKDAKVLEAAHAEAILKKDPLYLRYAFYCANSYKDYGLFEEAIKWYKITLTQENWAQEKYVSCLNIYDCYEKINQKEAGFFYLVKAFKYDTERVECLFPLLVHYCSEGQHNIAYGYYLIVKEYYENQYLNANIEKKLFISIDKYNFLVPYYMILIADRVKDIDCIIRMFEIVFIKKMPIIDNFYIRNFLYNLQFFVQHVKPENKNQFISLANQYFKFLHSLGISLNTIECLKDYDKRFGIDVSYIFYNLTITDKNKNSIFSKEECASSKNILIYTGFMYFLWNDTYVSNKSIGGAEKAVAYLSRYFSKEYNIFISGDVEDEVIDNITYINRNKLQNLLETTRFHTIVVSRYVSFFLMYKNFSCYKLFLSAHDSTGFINNVDNNCIPLNDIIETWNPIIDGCIALTTWHKNNIITAHPSLKDKIHIINNGIIPELFNIPYKKIRNKFVWTSCSYRGLHLMLNLWNEILDNIPDATLDIASYDTFPKNANDEIMLEFILKYPNSIKLHGKLNTTQLINLISSAEYWLYTNTFPETSCITGMEMLMSQVICLYYPLAGLLDTVGEYGIQVNPGFEIDTILNLTENQKIMMRKRGKEYALSCSWSNRAKEWENILFKDLNRERERIYELHNIGFIPKNHVNFLKKLSIDFTPKVIYDIGSNVLTWTREVRQIWSNTEIFAFDAIKNAEFFYKENNVNYHIGVLSKEDNYPIKFYENVIHPAGNSYYKEIGHSKSDEIYPEDKFTEQIAMTLKTVVQNNNFLLPDLIKIDVQGAELDIIKGGLDIINNAKYLIVELQDTEYNRGAPLAAITIKFLEENGWELIAPKFCDNGPDADYCFKNKRIFYEPTTEIKTFIRNLYDRISIPQNHINYLKKLAIDFEPKVIYDIGSAVLHWTREACKIWPNTEIIAFDAVQDTEFFYKEHKLKYNIGVLSDKDNKIVKFYGNIYTLGGNSYYKEIGHSKSNEIYPENLYTEQKTISLASVVSKNNFLLPDLIKMDVQGAELDIIKGGIHIINNAKYLILELQDTQYNRGAPLAGETIKFLEDNNWELIAPKFCDNGPDADYCFKNKRYNSNLKWAFLMPSWFVSNGLDDYFDNLKTLYNIIYTKDINYLKAFNPIMVTFVYEINDTILNYCYMNNIKFSFLNTEPLSINARLQLIISTSKKIKNIKIYDYSKSNIKILNQNKFTNTEYLPYIITKEENDFLKNINKTTKKIYDFGFITYDNPISCIRRENVVIFLIENGFKVHIISNLWKKARDVELAKCRIILNIHGAFMNNTPSHIFEHLRCDRLLEAGYKILSEDSYCLDQNYIEKYKDNLQIIKYDDFLNVKTYKNLDWLMKTNKIIDCFVFYNEINMLTYRLNLLNDVVDYFILVEAKQTYVGKSKPLFYSENKHLFDKFNDKIIHIVVDLPFNKDTINISNNEQWVNEKFQRNCISQGLDKIILLDQDLIIISDVDEIPDPNTLKILKMEEIDIGIRCLQLDFYYYNLNSKMDHLWPLTKILSYKKYKELSTTCENIRKTWAEPILRGGWHLSFFGDLNFIKNKLENFSHQEYNSDAYTNTEKIQEKIDKCIDLFDRNTKITYINIKDNQYLPPLYHIYLSAFYN